MYLDELSMTEFRDKTKRKNLVVILPIGAVEAHGSHLPLSTDSLQPLYIAERVAKKLNAIIAPPIWYGNCQSTRNFPGTLSLSFTTLHAVAKEILLELVRNGVRNIVVLSGHAGMLHMAALRHAAQDVVESCDKDGCKVNLMVLSDYDLAYELLGKDVPTDDGHAGMLETSRVLAIKPNLVRIKGRNVKKGVNRLPKFRVLSDPHKYWNATSGDPTKATAALGRKVNNYVVDALTIHIQKMIG